MPKDPKIVKKSPHHGDTTHYSHYVVRPDMNADNGYREWDTVDLIAQAWLIQNPGAALNGRKITGSRYHQIKQVGRWIIETNHLKDAQGRDCYNNKFTYPLIYPGLELDLPKGNPVMSFEQAFLKCDKPPEPLKMPEAKLDLEIIPQIQVVREEPQERHVHFRTSSPSSYGEYYRPGTMDHALMTLARTGLASTRDPKTGKYQGFTEEYDALKNIVARKPVTMEGNAGQIGEDGFPSRAGSNYGKNRQSRLDDDSHKKLNNGTGGKGLLGSTFSGTRTSVHFPQNAVPVNEGEEQGSYHRNTGGHIEIAHGGDYAYAMGVAGLNPFVRITVPSPKPKWLPVGASWSIPANQQKFFATTQDWGITGATTALAEVNFGGKHNLFRDQRARITEVFESPSRIYDYTHLLNSKHNLEEAMSVFDATNDPAVKKAAAERALVAYRDMFGYHGSTVPKDKQVTSHGNKTLLDADAKYPYYEQSGKGLRNYLSSQGIDVASIDARLPSIEPLDLVDMPQEQLEQQQDYKRLKKTRYAGFKPGETNEAYRATKPFVFYNQNYFENEAANLRGVEHSKQKMMERAEESVNIVLGNPGARKALIGAMSAGGDTTVETVAALADMWRNPSNFGFKSQDEVDRVLITPLLGPKSKENSQVRREVTKQGGTSPVPFTADDRFRNQDPRLSGKALAKGFAEHPEALDNLMMHASSLQKGFGAYDKKGRTDGRVHGVAILASLARANDAPTKNAFGSHYAAVAAAFATQGAEGSLERSKAVNDELILRQTVLDAQVGVEKGYSGRSFNAAQWVDNTMADEEVLAKNGLTTPAKTLHRVYNSSEAKAHNAAEIAVQGLRKAPAQGPDALLQAMLRTPEAFTRQKGKKDGLEDLIVDAASDGDVQPNKGGKPKDTDGIADKMTSVADSSNENRYRALRRALRRTLDAAEEYKTSGDEKDLKRAVQQFGRFHTLMEANIEKNDGALRHNAWNVALDFVAKDPRMGPALLDAQLHDEAQSLALLQRTPGLSTATDGVRVTNQGKSGKGKQFASVTDDPYYTPQMYELPRDKHGHVKKHDGFLNLGRSKVKVDLDKVAAVVANTQMAQLKDEMPQANVQFTEDMTPFERAQAQALQAGGLQGVTQHNAYGHNPQIFSRPLQLDQNLTPAQQQKQLEQVKLNEVVGWLHQTGFDKKIHQVDSKVQMQEVARFMLTNQFIHVKQDLNQLIFSLDSDKVDFALQMENMRSTKNHGQQIGVVPGVSANWAFALLGFIKGAGGAGICPTCIIKPYYIPNSEPTRGL